MQPNDLTSMFKEVAHKWQRRSGELVQNIYKKMKINSIDFVFNKLTSDVVVLCCRSLASSSAAIVFSSFSLHLKKRLLQSVVLQMFLTEIVKYADL